MDITTDMIKELRAECGAGVMECRTALVAAAGDKAGAMKILREKGFEKAEKSVNRATTQGLVESYVHAGGRIGAMVEVKCETDFVARTDEFKQMAHNLAMQVAAMCPTCLDIPDMPQDKDLDPKVVCLLQQPYIKDPAKIVRDIVVEVIAKTGENCKVTRFVRFELGE